MTRVTITRGLALICGLVMLFTLASAWALGPAQAKQPDQPTTAGAQSQAPAMEELVEMRERNRKVYKYNEPPQIVNGREIERRTMVVNTASVHYKDNQGQWQDVDTTPVDAGAEFRVDKVNAPVRLPKTGVDPMRITVGEDTLSVRLVGANASPASLRPAPGADRATRVVFADLFPQTDIAYEAEPDGVREFITLKAAGHPNEFTFQVVTPLSLSLDNGEILFRDGVGNVVGKFDRPWVSVPGAPYTTRWGSLSLAGNRVTMSLPDLSGLSYPIVVDPTLSRTISTGANDGYAVPAWSSWNNNDVRVNFGKGLSGETYNTTVRWDTFTAVPQGTTITAASVTFTADNSQSAGTTAVRIKAAAGSDNDQVDSYTEWSGITRTTAAVNWTVPATTLDATFISPDITSVIQEAVNHSGFNGAFLVFFEDNGSSSGATRSAYSYDGNTSKTASLSVTYNISTSYFRPNFTDRTNGTTELYLSASDIQGLQIDIAQDNGSGLGSYSTSLVTYLSTGGNSIICGAGGYSAEGRWKAEVSSNATSVKWRVRVASAKTAYNASCVSSTTTEAHTFWVTTVPGLGSGVDNYQVGLGIWP